LASLSFLSEGRVLAGIGLGSSPKELTATGFNPEQREIILQETVEICRKVWTENNVSYKGEIFGFQDVSIDPKTC